MLAQLVSIKEMLATYWPVAVVSFLVSILATPICRSFATRHGITDKPDAFLKPHEQATPYLGGVAIFFGWAAGIILALIMFNFADRRISGSEDEFSVSTRVIVFILVAGMLTTLLGLFDDLHALKPRHKLFGNIGIALLLIVGAGLGDDVIRVITSLARIDIPYWLMLLYSVPITIFIVVGACNATNLIDGIDGLCSGVLGIISLGFLIISAHMHMLSGWTDVNMERVIISLAMMGASLGFLPYNRNPATIFMGDAGSMLLGLNAAILILLSFEDQFKVRWTLAAITVFGLPLADMLLTLARRWRAQRPLMQGDRSHFYDQLLDRGLPVRKVVLISYLLAAFYVVAGCAAIVIRTRYSLLVYVAVVILTAWAIAKFRMVRVDQNRGSGSERQS